MESHNIHYFTGGSYTADMEVPSLVDGKRRYLALVSDFVSWDETCRVMEPVSPTIKSRNLHVLP